MNTAVVPTQANPQSETSDSLSERLEKLDQLSHWLDSSIRIPVIGYPIGWDTIIGLIPGVGDLATTMFSAWIIREAQQLGVSKFTLARMIANTSLDTLVGVVPVAGDLFDAMFKSNVKNLKLLRSSLARQGLGKTQEFR